MKSYLRRNCAFNFDDLKSQIDILLKPGGIPIETIQKFSRFCYRFMDGYRQGLSGPILDYTLKKCKSHRTIPVNLVKEVMGPDGLFAKYEESKNKRK